MQNASDKKFQAHNQEMNELQEQDEEDLQKAHDEKMNAVQPQEIVEVLATQEAHDKAMNELKEKWSFKKLLGYDHITFPRSLVKESIIKYFEENFSINLDENSRFSLQNDDFGGENHGKIEAFCIEETLQKIFDSNIKVDKLLDLISNKVLDETKSSRTKKTIAVQYYPMFPKLKIDSNKNTYEVETIPCEKARKYSEELYSIAKKALDRYCMVEITEGPWTHSLEGFNLGVMRIGPETSNNYDEKVYWQFANLMSHSTNEIKDDLGCILLQNAIVNAYNTCVEKDSISQDNFVKILLKGSTQANNTKLQTLGKDFFAFAKQQHAHHKNSLLLEEKIVEIYNTSIKGQNMSENQCIAKFVEKFKEAKLESIAQQYYRNSEEPVHAIAKELAFALQFAQNDNGVEIIKNRINILRVYSSKDIQTPEEDMHTFNKIWMPSITVDQFKNNVKEINAEESKIIKKQQNSKQLLSIAKKKNQEISEYQAQKNISHQDDMQQVMLFFKDVAKNTDKFIDHVVKAYNDRQDKENFFIQLKKQLDNMDKHSVFKYSSLVTEDMANELFDAIQKRYPEGNIGDNGAKLGQDRWWKEFVEQLLDALRKQEYSKALEIVQGQHQNTYKSFVEKLKEKTNNRHGPESSSK